MCSVHRPATRRTVWTLRWSVRKAAFHARRCHTGLSGAEVPAAIYRKALADIADHVRANFSGKTFAQLSPTDQDKVLSDLEKGTIVLKNTPSAPFFTLLLQNTTEGFFADPIYGGNRDMVGWKLVGFPGARYDYRDWVDRHNEVLSAASRGNHGSFRLVGNRIVMARKLPPKDVAIIGLGWTGSILAYEWRNRASTLWPLSAVRGVTPLPTFLRPMFRTNCATRFVWICSCGRNRRL